MSAFANPLTERLAGFIRDIGLPIQPATLGQATLLPGVTVRDGAVLVDEAALLYPGDLLHEAGHLAVSDPATRTGLAAVGEDPGEEMAAAAWSYAAARHLGLDPAVVFHAAYKGGGAAMVKAFDEGGIVGQPMLEWFGMTLGRRAAAEQGQPPFPHMLRWLR